jgi:hypothetical protein
MGIRNSHFFRNKCEIEAAEITFALRGKVVGMI